MLGSFALTEVSVERSKREVSRLARQLEYQTIRKTEAGPLQELPQRRSDDIAGLVPASLLRWELTGLQPDEVKRMLAPR